MHIDNFNEIAAKDAKLDFEVWRWRLISYKPCGDAPCSSFTVTGAAKGFYWSEGKIKAVTYF